MSRPTDTGSVSETIYADLERFQYDELRYDYALLKYLGALGLMFQPVDDLARDTDEGPGWSHIVDLNRVPDEGVRWLGQFVGARPPSDATIAYMRQYVAAKPEWQRGSVGAMIQSIQRYLTGDKSVILRERDSSPYHFTVYTYATETPGGSSTDINNAIVAQKPAGLQYSYSVVSGWTYETLMAQNADYQSVFTKYTTYGGVLSNTPGA